MENGFASRVLCPYHPSVLPLMTESGKILIATALSVLVHVSFFTVLALMRESAPIAAAPAQSASERPLEIVLQTVTLAPAPESTPVPAALAHMEEPPVSANIIRTQIDPENLRKTDEAPEHAAAVAAHHSRATPPVANVPPPPAPSATSDSGDLTLQAARPTPTPEEIGIDALGHYGKAVGNAIGLRSEALRKSWEQPLVVGEVRVQFVLNATGKVSDIQILSNTAGPANAACAERAVKEAAIPPIPSDRLAQVPGGRIRIVYSFTIYPSP